MRALALIFLAALALVLLVASPARAHGMRSVYVEIVEQSPGHARVTMRAQVPVSGARIATNAPCTLQASGEEVGATVETLLCPSGVAGAMIRVEGLGPIVSEAVVWVALADGTSTSHLLTQNAPSWSLPRDDSWVSVARDYVSLGVHHILGGADHLLFLVGLVLCLRRVRAVLVAEAAFTVSHSITYSASALGWVHVSSGAAEACIALSLVLVALEACRRWSSRGEGASELGTSSVRGAAVLAFVFGLVHGLGFAGGLSEIGLPARAIPAALAGFAMGVEIGQVAFLVAVLALFAAARRARAHRFISVADVVGAYAVGVIGCFWLFERLRALLFTTT